MTKPKRRKPNRDANWSKGIIQCPFIRYNGHGDGGYLACQLEAGHKIGHEDYTGEVSGPWEVKLEPPKGFNISKVG